MQHVDAFLSIASLRVTTLPIPPHAVASDVRRTPPTPSNNTITHTIRDSVGTHQPAHAPSACTHSIEPRRLQLISVRKHSASNTRTRRHQQRPTTSTATPCRRHMRIRTPPYADNHCALGEGVRVFQRKISAEYRRQNTEVHRRPASGSCGWRDSSHETTQRAQEAAPDTVTQKGPRPACLIIRPDS